MNEPIDHHYIPRFHLQKWCNSKGKLIIYSRPHDVVVTSERAPRSTAYEPYLYSYSNVPVEQQQILEKQFMAPVDDAAAQVLEKLLSGGLQLSDVERVSFTLYVLSLRARHPDAVELFESRGKETLKEELLRRPEEYDRMKASGSPQTLLDFTMQVMPSALDNFGKSLIPSVVTNKEIIERVFRMKWGLVDFTTASTDLLISDRPCILEGNAKDGRCVIALPLSPKAALFISNDVAQIALINALTKSELVKILNRCSVEHAKKYVYGTGAHHLKFVERRL